MERHAVKVDCRNISLKKDKSQNRDNQLVLYNINIPPVIVYNNENLIAVLERIKNLILCDFEGEYVEFQLTANFNFKHTKTNKEKSWTGSYNEEDDCLDYLLHFQAFNSENFVKTCFKATNHIEDKFIDNNFDRKWKYDQLISIIINFESEVSQNHPIVIDRKLQTGGRKPNIFLLP